MLPLSQTYLLTAEQAAALDRWTFEGHGPSGQTLMEVAGRSVAQHLAKQMAEGSCCFFLCGPGNNGGDAYVTARHLALYRPDLLLYIAEIVPKKDSETDASVNRDRLKAIKTDHLHWLDPSVIVSKTQQLTENDRIIDGIFGVGLNRSPEGSYSQWIQAANASKAPITALDVPSGLNATHGNAFASCIEAEETLTFGTEKLGFYLNDGLSRCGHIHLIDLGYDLASFQESAAPIRFKKMLPNKHFESTKKETTHKYDGAGVIILGSSHGLTGATIAAAEAAWASGASAVFLLIPAGLLSIFEQKLPQAVKIPIGSIQDLWLKSAHKAEIYGHLKHLQARGSLICGPGLGRQPESMQLLQEMAPELHSFKQLIFDADALYCQGLMDVTSDGAILTPHPGELKQLAQQFGISESPRSSIKAAEAWCELAKSRSVHILSKGNPSMLFTASGDCYVAPFSDKSFRRSGFGDVLAGQIAALTASYADQTEAICQAMLQGNTAMKALSDLYHSPDATNIVDWLRKRQ